MCEQMTGTVIEIGRLVGFASPELRGLFEKWVKALEGEVIEFLKEKGSRPLLAWPLNSSSPKGASSS